MTIRNAWWNAILYGHNASGHNQKLTFMEKNNKKAKGRDEGIWMKGNGRRKLKDNEGLRNVSEPKIVVVWQ